MSLPAGPSAELSPTDAHRGSRPCGSPGSRQMSCGCCHERCADPGPVGPCGRSLPATAGRSSRCTAPARDDGGAVTGTPRAHEQHRCARSDAGTAPDGRRGSCTSIRTLHDGKRSRSFRAGRQPGCGRASERRLDVERRSVGRLFNAGCHFGVTAAAALDTVAGGDRRERSTAGRTAVAVNRHLKCRLVSVCAVLNAHGHGECQKTRQPGRLLRHKGLRDRHVGLH